MEVEYVGRERGDREVGDREEEKRKGRIVL